MISDGTVPNEAYVVIGNGFDIECGLPTTYKDFLKVELFLLLLLFLLFHQF